MSLAGKTVAITRPQQDAEETANLVSRLGGKPYIAPIVEVGFSLAAKRALQIRRSIMKKPPDHIVFMSKNGVRALFKMGKNVREKRRLIGILNRIPITAVGPTTHAELAQRGVKSACLPSKYSSQGVLNRLKKIRVKSKNVMLIRTKNPPDFLRTNLLRLGAKVNEVALYESSRPKSDRHPLRLISAILNQEIDVITFTSAGGVNNLFSVAIDHSLEEKLRKGLNKSIVAAVGPVTSKALRKFGVKVSVVPTRYTATAMIQALTIRKRSHRKAAMSSG